MPTVEEAGVPGYESTIWLGLMAPAGTPKPVDHKSMQRSRRSRPGPTCKENWAKQGAMPMTMSPAEFDQYLRADIDKWGNVVKVSGAKL